MELREKAINRAEFDAVMEAIGPLGDNILASMIALCQEAEITPVIGIMTLQKMCERNLEINKPLVPEGTDDGWAHLGQWIDEALDEHLRSQPGVVN